jgi:uncharacterized protein
LAAAKSRALSLLAFRQKIALERRLGYPWPINRKGGAAMLRQRFNDALKAAMKEKEALVLSTVRLIIAKLKEQDIEARAKGSTGGIGDNEIQQMLQSMIKQRRESIALYERGGRPELAEKERGEIAIIERFLPTQLSDGELEAAVKTVMAAIGAQGIKDIGRVMTALKERYAGQIDGAKASQMVKRLLGQP